MAKARRDSRQRRIAFGRSPDGGIELDRAIGGANDPGRRRKNMYYEQRRIRARKRDLERRMLMKRERGRGDESVLRIMRRAKHRAANEADRARPRGFEIGIVVREDQIRTTSAGTECSSEALDEES